MLLELRVRDLAIIESVRAEFGPGLNVLSGETGAGKSIVVDALSLALGGRAAGELVRAGVDRAVVEAVFRIDERPDLMERLQAQGLEADGEIVVRREIVEGGRGRAWLNGSPVTQGMLSQLLDEMVEIHGQHEHQRLLRREAQLVLLDRAGKGEALRERLAGKMREWRSLDAERTRLRMSEEERLRQIDYLRFQIDEIAQAAPEPGEEEDLAGQRGRLANAARLLESAAGAEAGLYSGEGAVVESIGRAATSLAQAGSLDPGLAPLAARLEAALREIEDIARELGDYATKLTHDPERLAEVEERLETLRRLMRKYGPALSDVCASLDQARAELASLEGRDERIAEIEEACAALAAEGAELSRELSSVRARTAAALSRRVAKELEALGMGRATFQVAVTPIELPPPGFGERGSDSVEFLISPNPGEPPRALARIASGGELSRVMLALQTVLAESEKPATLVFDEADAGVGGRVADAVGQRLAGLAAAHQVICLTHLPQIAARGDRHLRVTKAEAEGRTVARLSAIDGDARVEEIARMSGGAAVTEATRAHARDLLRRSGRGDIAQKVRGVGTPTRGGGRA